MFAKIGPGANTMLRRPVSGSSWMISVPVMSDGITSGVNWIRENLRSRTSATVWINNVFASPGTPRSRLLPPTKRERSICSMTSSCPIMSFRTSVMICSRPAFIRSAMSMSSGLSRAVASRASSASASASASAPASVATSCSSLNAISCSLEAAVRPLAMFGFHCCPGRLPCHRGRLPWHSVCHRVDDIVDT